MPDMKSKDPRQIDVEEVANKNPSVDKDKLRELKEFLDVLERAGLRQHPKNRVSHPFAGMPKSQLKH